MMRAKHLTVLGAVMITVTSAFAQRPTLPFVDKGACPFEGCVYQRDWTAKARVVAYQTWDSHAPVRSVFVIEPGETVTAMTGVVLVTSAGRAQIRRRMTVPGLVIEPGTLVYLMTPHGEGHFTAFVNRVPVDMDIANLEQPTTPGAGYSGCVRTRTCDGKVLDYPKLTWWVQIRNAAGRIGWTSHTDDFDGKDALGT
jgi:hypothetical protein